MVNLRAKYKKGDGSIFYDDSISMEDAAHGYRGLMVIERCFRSLKRTQIRMMPMYHWLLHRIEAHVKICVLALLIERLSEIKCGKQWSQIRTILGKMQATELKTPGHVFFQLNELPTGAKTILDRLTITRPHKVFCVKRIGKSGAVT